MTGRAAGYVVAPRFDLVDERRRRIRLRPTVHRAASALLRSAEPITAAQLIDAVWPDERPRDPAAALATVLSRLRAALEPGALHTTPDGYLLYLPGPRHIPLPFLGRDADLAALARLMHRHDGVLVTGGPGSGKSRLLAEFAAAGERRGMLVRVGGAEHLDALADDLRAAAHAPGGTVVVVDDADRLDDAVLELLLALGDVAEPKFVAAAGDAAPTPLAALLASGAWARHRLHPLETAAVDALTAAAGWAPDAVGAARAGGNPELLNALLRDPASTAATVSDVISRRLARTGGAAADTLLAVALAGYLSWTTAESFPAIDTLENADLVAADETGVRPASAAVAEAAITTAGHARRRRTLERLIAATDSPVQRARWTLQVGDRAAPAEHHAAARALLAAGDPDEAERHAGLAFDSDPNPAHAATWTHALLLGSLPAHEITARLASLTPVGPPSRTGPPVEAFVATLAFLKDADADEAQRILATAPEHPMTDVARALIAAYLGRPDPGGALTLAQAAADAQTRAAAWSTWFLAAGLCHDPALDTLAPTLTTESTGLSAVQLGALVLRRSITRGDLDGVPAELDRLKGLTELADLRQRSLLHVLASEAAFAGGDLPTAIRDAVLAVDLLRRSGHRSDERVGRQWLALTLACAGRADEASTALEQARRARAAAVIGEHHAELAQALIGGDSPQRAVERAAVVAARHRIDANPLWPQVLAVVESAADPLTPREREVIMLVAARWTSREIAERLGLSARTVQNHTARAYRKLGVHRRAELPAAMKSRHG